MLWRIVNLISLFSVFMTRPWEPELNQYYCFLRTFRNRATSNLLILQELATWLVFLIRASGNCRIRLLVRTNVTSSVPWKANYILIGTSCAHSRLPLKSIQTLLSLWISNFLIKPIWPKIKVHSEFPDDFFDTIHFSLQEIANDSFRDEHKVFHSFGVWGIQIGRVLCPLVS